MGHDGTEHTRVFRSVQKTGSILKQTDEIAGTMPRAKAAVIFDWENMWALDDCQGYAQQNKKYLDTCYAYHRLFWLRGMDCDVISPKADLSGYEIVVAPMLYLADDETVRNLTGYVSGGGTLWATYMLGTVDENDLCRLGGIPGGGLTDVFGIEAEEIDTLYPAEQGQALMNGKLHALVDYCEVLKLRGAEVLASYAADYYKDTPAVTCHRFGKGRAVYQACRDTGSLGDAILEQLIPELDLSSPLGTTGKLPQGITAHSRTDGENTYVFLENYLDQPAPEIPLPHPMTDLLTGETVSACTLGGYGYAILKA